MISPGWRRALARSRHPFALAVRAVYEAPEKLSVPIPKAVAIPAVLGYRACRSIAHTALRIFVAEPFFKAHVTGNPRGLHTGIFIHWIKGKGEIIVGENSLFDGKISITFAHRFSDNPQLIVGSGTEIAHGCDITIGKEVRIGNHCRVAAHVIITDSSGHPSEPGARLAGAPPSDDDVRPVTIEDNVWIGKRAIVLPGVTIGEGSIVAAGSVVMSDIPPYTLAAGNPARKVAPVPRRDLGAAPESR